MANKQTVQQDYIVNIKARADQLTKELNGLRDILNNLKLDPNFAKSAEATIGGMIKKIGAEMDKMGNGFISEKQANMAAQRLSRMGNEIQRFGKEFSVLGLKAEDVFMSSGEYQEVLKKIQKLKDEMSNLQKAATASKGSSSSKYSATQRGSLAEAAKAGQGALTKKSAEIERNIREEQKRNVDQKAVKRAMGGAATLEEAKANKQAELASMKGQKNPDRRKVLKEELDLLNEQLNYEKAIKDLRADTARLQNPAKNISTKQGQITKAQTAAQDVQDQLIKQAQSNIDAVVPQTNSAAASFQNIAKNANEAGKSIETYTQKTKGVSEIGNYFKHMLGPTMLLMRAVQTVKQVFQDFMEIDKQLNEISIVTGKSMENLWGNFERLNSLAQEYGVKTSDVIAVQKLYYQQGRSAAEVTQLQGETLKFAKISGLDFADATDKMTAAINAYKISAADASKVTDVYAALSAKAAVDAEEVAVAMSKVASIAALSGSEFEDTSAYLSKIIETTREAPETAGTALKTVIARFTEVKDLTEDQKELLDEDYNFNNIEKALKTVGVAVKDSVGNMRGFTDILNDLGPIWDNLSSNQQHYIATMAAGSRQQSRFIALMDDWGRTEELTSVAAQSAGTGNKQLALSLESIETSTNRLAASWQEFYTNFLSSDLFKTIIDGANKFLSILNEIADIGGVFGPALIVAVLAITKALITSAFHMGQGFWKSFKAGYESVKGASEAADLAKDTAKTTKKAGFLGRLWGKIKGQTQAAAEDIEEEKKHQKDMGDAVRHGTLEGTTEGKAHGRAEALGQKAGKIGKGFGKFKQGFKHPFKTLGAGKAESGKKVLTLSRGTGMGGKVVGGKIATSAGTAGVAGAGTGAGAGAGAAGAAGVLGTVGAVASIAAAVIAAFAIGTAIFHAAVAAEEKEILENTQKAQEDIDKRKQEVADMSSSYNEALELERKGLLKTEEETERYQEILTGLKETYPQLVKTMADGTLALNDQTEAYDNLVDSQIEAIKKQNEVYNAISENKNVAIAAGVVTTEEGRKLQESIKNTAASLSAMTSDNIELLTGVNIDPEEFQEMAEKGLNRQTLNEALHTDFGNFMFQGYDTSDGYANFLNGIIDNHIETMATEEAKVFEYLAAQSGRTAAEMAQVLKDQTSNKSIASAQLDNLGSAIASKYGDTYSTALTAAFTKAGATKEENVKEEDWEYDTKKSEDLMEKYYSVLTQRDRDEFEKFVDSISTTADKNSLATLVGNLDDPDVDAVMTMYGLTPDMRDMVVAAIEDATKARDEALRGANGDGGYLGQILESQGKAINQANMDALEQELADYSLEQIKAMGTAAAQVAAKYGQGAGQQAYQLRTELLDMIGDNETIAKQFGQVDLFDTEAVAKFESSLISAYGEGSKEVEKFNELAEKSSYILDRNFKNVSQVATTAKSDITALKEGIESLSDAAEGSLDLEGMFDLVAEFSSILSFDDFTATANGYTLSAEKLESIQEKMLEVRKAEYRLQIEQYKLSLKQLQQNMKTQGVEFIDEQIKKYEGKTDKESLNQVEQLKASKTLLSGLDLNEFAELQNKIAAGEDYDTEKYGKISEALTNAGYIEEANLFTSNQEAIEAMEAILRLIGALDYESETVAKKIKKRIDALKNYIENLEKIEIFIDLDSFDKQLSLDMAHYDFVIEFSTNADEIAEATENKLVAATEQMNSSIARAQANESLAATTRKDITNRWGNYVKFDEEGNVMLQEDALAAKAKEIYDLEQKGDDASLKKAETLQEEYNLLYKQVDKYREYNEQGKEARINAEKQAAEMKKIVTQQYQNIVDAEDMWRDLLIQRDEDALDSLEKRYDAIKEMDEEYLDSVREAIEEERRIRDNANEYEDIAKMERKLNMLRMSGGSAVEIQKLEEELNKKRQDWNDSQVDQILDDMEKNNEMRAAALDDEVEYERAVLDEKKKNQIAYNEEIKTIMSKSKEEQLKIWKELDAGYAASSEANKVLLLDKTQSIIDKAGAAKKLIGTNKDGVLPTIDKAVRDLANKIDADPDSAGKQTENFANTITTELGSGSKALKTVDTLRTKFINMGNNIANAREALGFLLEDLKAYNLKVGEVNAGKAAKSNIGDSITIGGRTYGKIGDKWYDQDQFSEVNWITGEGVLKEGAKEQSQGYSDMNADVSSMKRIVGAGGQTFWKIGDRIYKDQDITLRKNKNGNITGYKVKLDAEDFAGRLGDIMESSDYSASKSGTYVTIEGKGLNSEIQTYGTTKQKDGSYKLIKNLNQTHEITKFNGETYLRPANSSYYYKWKDMEIGGFKVKDSDGKAISLKRIKKGQKAYTLNRYATGGIVDYTGPAWVDGTPSKPEAFLSAKDTALIASLTDVLSFRTKGFSSVTPVQNSGDTYYQIHINVDELGDGYSVDDLIDEMEERILAVTGKTGVIKVN